MPGSTLGAMPADPALRRIPEHILAEIRARLPLDSLVGRSTRLRRSGSKWRGPCPLHNGRSHSLQVGADTFHCYGCGAHGDVFAWLMRTEGCDFRQAVLRCAAEAGVPLEGDPGERTPFVPPQRDPARDRAHDEARRLRFAAHVWTQTAPIAEGSPQARYLAGRGLWPLPEHAHQVLRAASRGYPPDGEGEERTWPAGRGRHPVMVARIDSPGRPLSAVHVTYLAARQDGSVGKLAVDDAHSAKLMFGLLPPGAAVRLFPPAARMGVAEGIETALAAARLFAPLPVWSTLSANGLRQWIPPRICAEAVILADRDKPRTGRVWRPEGEGLDAARALAARLAEAGRSPSIRVPLEPAGDYADVLMLREQAA